MSELEPRDPALDDFVSDVVRAVERELDEDAPAPDLVAVLEMARTMDADAVPDGWVEEAALLATVVDLREGRKLRHTPDPTLDALIADVRAATEHEIGVELARHAAPVSSSGAAEAEPSDAGSPRRSWALGLAAAALLLVGAAGLLTARVAQRQEEPRPLTAVSEHEPATRGELEPREVELRTPTRSSTEPLEAEANLPEDVADELEATDGSEDDAAGSDPKRARVPSESLADRLARLDAEAHAAWKADDPGLARTKFEKIVSMGGRHRLADLAYGDLFTLARTRGDEREERRLWRAYLRRFPRGRFADDARAGLCRAASGSAQAECWERYLRDMPTGSYRAQAERALAQEEK